MSRDGDSTVHIEAFKRHKEQTEKDIVALQEAEKEMQKEQMEQKIDIAKLCIVTSNLSKCIYGVIVVFGGYIATHFLDYISR